MKNRLEIDLDDEAVEWLEGEAEHHGITVAELIELIVGDHIKAHSSLGE